jgi:hypothetical protein
MKLNLNFSLVCFSVVLIYACASQKERGLVGHQKERGLVGYWKLQRDCNDYSGQGNHGINHGVKLDSGVFNGTDAYIEIPSSPSLQLGTGDFSISAWVYTENEINGMVGDVMEKYDPALRKGITLSINSSAGGYQSQGTDRHVYFGIDNAKSTDWEDCGRPSLTSNYVSNSLTVFKGKLYAAITGAKEEKDWAHVFRYEGNQKWTDCGKVGNDKTAGVGPLIVHNGDLYAITSTLDWTRVHEETYGPGRVYRYAGGTQWNDLGQPGDSRTLHCAASYKGKLYVGVGPDTWAVFTQDKNNQWKVSKIFPKEGPQRLFPHCMSTYNGKLYVGMQSVHSFDGEKWTYAGVPVKPQSTLQTQSLSVYQGRLIAGTWPEAKVSRYLGGENWEEFGRVGEDGTEVNALVVYNGKLYGGSIPRAEVCRYDDDPIWTSLKRFYSPDGWIPALPFSKSRQESNEWSRLTSLTIYNGKLFASTGSCTSSPLDAPADVRGKVFNMEAGKNATFDDDLGSGWKHLAAVREKGLLKLYIGGKFVASSSSFEPADYNVANDKPLHIGSGQFNYFYGKIAEVRMYNRALDEGEIRKLSTTFKDHPYQRR